jgi:hypothetical protein
MSVKSFLIMGCLSLGALSVGCGGDHDGHGHGGMQGGGGANSGDYNYSCSVSIGPDTLSYILDGDVLTVRSDLEPDSLSMTREGSASGLYDSWLMHVSDDGVLESRLIMELAADSVILRNECAGLDGAFGVAEVTSRAVYTDTTFTTLDSADDEVEF